MKKILVPFADTHQFSPLVDDYLLGAAALNPFYRLAPEPASFEKAITERRKFPCNRKLLCERLLEQYGDLLNEGNPDSAIVKEAIISISGPDGFTVTTGHQLNIFTGPLYAIYKIATTIKLATELKHLHPLLNFVPVFWMASEDHDFAEINHTRIFGKEVIWNGIAGGAVGRMSPIGMISVLNEVKEIMGNDKACIDLFETAYLSSATLTEATRKIVHALFAKSGLVVIDGDDALLKKEFVNEMRNDLLTHVSYDAVTATTEKLSKIYKSQVQPRQINLFYLSKGIRERIVKNNDSSYTVLNTSLTFTRNQILDELTSHPENFSPNVVLRPIYQEKILPNLAYIGGPGELNYWLQFMDAFDANKVPFPVLLLRNCFQLIDKNSISKLEKLGITIPEIFESSDMLVSKVLKKTTAVQIKTEAISKLLQDAFNNLGEEWLKLDPSLLSSIDAEKQKALKGLAGLEEKAARALKRKNELLVNQVKNVKDKLFPGGGLQERSDNFLPYYCRFKEEFINEIILHSNPFEKHFIILEET